MPRLPRITAKELVKILQQHGFKVVSQRGSHMHLENTSTGHFTTVPMHTGKIIGPGLLKAIFRQAGIDPLKIH